MKRKIIWVILFVCSFIIQNAYAKKIVIALQTADSQANIQQDTITILALGRKYIVEELKKKLKQIKSI